MSTVLGTRFDISFIMTLYYKMQQKLLKNATAILLQNATKFYYKMRQLPQKAIFITNCDSTLDNYKSFCTSHQICRDFRYFWDQFERIICKKRNLQFMPELVIPQVNFFLRDNTSLRSFGSVSWNSLPIEITDHHLIFLFATKIKKSLSMYNLQNLYS